MQKVIVIALEAEGDVLLLPYESVHSRNAARDRNNRKQGNWRDKIHLAGEKIESKAKRDGYTNQCHAAQEGFFPFSNIRYFITNKIKQ